MRLKPEQLASDLSKGLQAIYVVSSDEPLLIDEAVQQIRAAALKSGAERQSDQVETGFNWGGWFGSFDSLSLFASRTLVELRIPTGKPGVEGGKTLEAWCQQPPADTLLLVIMPRADKATQSTKWFSALDRSGVVLISYAPTPEQMPAWIGERLARHQLKADRETLAFLTARVEGNLLAAHQEVEKLALILPPGPVSLDDARSAVTDVARFDATDLPEVLLKGDRVRYCRILDGLQAEGETPILAIWLMAQELRTLHRLAVGAAQGESLPGLMKQLRVWDSRQPLVGRALKRLSVNRISQAMRLTARADRASKGLLREDAWAMLKRIGLGLMDPPIAFKEI